MDKPTTVSRCLPVRRRGRAGRVRMNAICGTDQPEWPYTLTSDLVGRSRGSEIREKVRERNRDYATTPGQDQPEVRHISYTVWVSGLRLRPDARDRLSNVKLSRSGVQCRTFLDGQYDFGVGRTRRSSTTSSITICLTRCTASPSSGTWMTMRSRICCRRVTS